jgi:hypothetical protein
MGVSGCALSSDSNQDRAQPLQSYNLVDSSQYSPNYHPSKSLLQWQYRVAQ